MEVEVEVVLVVVVVMAVMVMDVVMWDEQRTNGRERK